MTPYADYFNVLGLAVLLIGTIVVGALLVAVAVVWWLQRR